MVALTEPRPMATVSFALDLVGTLDGLDPWAPLYVRTHSPHAGGGFATEQRELWGEDGRLLALNHQLVALVR